MVIRRPTPGFKGRSFNKSGQRFLMCCAYLEQHSRRGLCSLSEVCAVCALSCRVVQWLHDWSQAPGCVSRWHVETNKRRSSLGFFAELCNFKFSLSTDHLFRNDRVARERMRLLSDTRESREIWSPWLDSITPWSPVCQWRSLPQYQRYGSKFSITTKCTFQQNHSVAGSWIDFTAILWLVS